MVKVLYRKLIVVGSVLIGAIIAVIIQAPVNAVAANWSPDSDISIKVNEASNVPFRPEIVGQRPCVVQRTVVQGQLDLQDVCFMHGINVSYGYYRTIYAEAVGVVKYKFDSKAYPVAGIGYADRTAILPGTDTLISLHQRANTSRNFTLTIQENVSRSLIKTRGSANILDGYSLGGTHYVFAPDEPGYTWPVTAVGYSNNNKWMVANVTNVGMVRFNLETGEVKRFSVILLANHAPYSPLQLSLAVSNDGRYAALGGAGFGVPFKIYTITDDCAEVFGTAYSAPTEPLTINPCPEIELRHEATHALPGSYNYEKNVSFSDDAGMLSFYAFRAESPTGKWMEVWSAGYVKPRLDYLAMGDSYSSGEGDTSEVYGTKFYLAGTDVEGSETVPREKCHISSRSYPFLLKDMMDIPDVNMKSIACSGAEAGKDYAVTNDYRGQNYNGWPRLDTLLPNDLQQYQDSARLNYIPGRVQQLEFISKYKPQAITITGGGNDIGFGDVLKSCLLSNYYACSYNNTQSGRAAIGQGIARQYYVLSALFAQINAISPDTKIYVIGYPQFMDDQSFFCAPNVPISQNERRMISEAVSYLNRTIEAAALRSGVKYVDIEDSLAGHKLCEKGTAYVTGLALARKIGFGSTVIGTSEEQESFHPNRNGHVLIARAVRSALGAQSLLDYSEYPTSPVPAHLMTAVTPPLYFAESMRNATKLHQKGDIIPRKYVQKLSTQGGFDIRFGGFAPYSQVRVENHSDPVILGTYFADVDGVVSANIPVPIGIPAGYHTLHLIGESYSGEPIDIWQSIEVRGAEGDIDEDGIADDVDACLYVAEAKIDDDGDGVDDACDVIIEDEKSSYHDEPSTRDDNLPIGAKQSINQSDSDGDLSHDSIEAQRVVESIFYIPSKVSDEVKAEDNTEDNTSHSILSGVVASALLVLIWAIKRYSSRNGRN